MLASLADRGYYLLQATRVIWYAKCPTQSKHYTIQCMRYVTSQSMKSVKELEMRMESMGNEVRRCQEGERNFF